MNSDKISKIPVYYTIEYIQIICCGILGLHRMLCTKRGNPAQARNKRRLI